MSPTLFRNVLRAAGGAVLTALAAFAAGAQTSQDVIFHATLDEHAGYSDVWGYTAPGGDEYALLGTWGGLSVVNVTEPAAPYQTGFISGAFSTWRDIKTYQHYAYVTNESSGGIMIVDLSDPENPVQRPSYAGISTAHNLFIDQATGRCYVAGSNLGLGGLRILSLQDPENPVEVGSWENLYLHDVVVNQDRAFVSGIYQRQLVILDVTDPAQIPPSLGIIQNYPSAFTHNADVMANNQFVMTTDETAGASVRLWDVSNPAAPVQTFAFRPNPAGAPHNVHIEGDIAYVSHYTAGVRIADLSDPYAVTEIAYIDTYPSGNGSSFDGCWGVFPYFGTTPGLFVASDIQSGLFVLEYRGPLGEIAGTVSEAGTAVAVPGARLEVLETGLASLADAAGDYTLFETAGPKTIQVTAFGYQTSSVPVDVVVGSVLPLALSLTPLPG
ncbi:MAG: choice-of-anchor B family protein, partial [Planctomycetota bacterium]